MVNPDHDPNAVAQEAFRLLQAGNTVQAEELVLRAAREAEAHFGKDSPTYAAAQNALGTVLLKVSDVDRAVEAFRAAVSVRWLPDEQARKDRLSYLTNLGTTLAQADDLASAEQVLRVGLDGRRELYGVEHPGYAFGLEPLAEVLQYRGRIDEALEAIDEAAANFWQNGHPRLASALALRAELLKAAESEEPPFENLEELPDALIVELASHVLSRVGETDPVLSCEVLADLGPLLEERLGNDHPLLLDVLAASANLERELGDEGDPELRRQAIQRVLDAHDRQGQPREALQAVLGLALALGDAGQQDQALAAYQDAVSRADRLGDPALQAQVHRDYGLYLADLHRSIDAESQLRLALTRATPVGDAELLGRCQVALGIFLQHGSRPDEAHRLLGDALRQLDPAHPDAVCARSHLNALASGHACGCGDPEKALAEAFQAFVTARLPVGLLERLDVEPRDRQFGVNVHLRREPIEEEAQQLDRVIRHALEEFKRRVVGQGR